MKPFLKPGMLDGNGAVYEQIRRAISDPILRGDWPAGARLPSEHELTRIFGTSRMTVNRALSELVTGGFIVRRRRAGTFVAAPTAQHPVLEINDIKAEVLSTGHPYWFELFERKVRPATATDRARLRLAAPGRVLVIRICHHAAATPFAYEDRLINLESVPAAEHEPFRDAPPGSWLIANVPWTEAEHRIRAVAANAALRRHLRLGAGVPSLLVERHTRRPDAPVTAVRLYYPGDRHELVARFSPRGPSGNNLKAPNADRQRSRR